MAKVRIREESSRDEAAVRTVLEEAFASKEEADMVDRVRGKTEPQLLLVAEDSAGDVIGSILFTPVEIHAPFGSSIAIGLAPMAVLPQHQHQGVGSALVRTGLSACRDLGEHVVVVLGHPGYYPRFGFKIADEFGLFYRQPGRNPAFMVSELEPGALQGRRGEVTYHPAFTAG